LNKNFDGQVKDIDQNKQLISEINKKIKEIEKNYYELNFIEAVKNILHISSFGNKYFQANEPWKLIKEDKEKVHKILGLSVNIVKNLSILIQPVLPNFSLNLQKQLNLENLKWEDIDFKLKNHKIGKEEILITKMEEKEETKQEFPLNLKVAKIIDIKEHPNADKLYVMQVDLGNERRQLVAGIRQHYSLDELKNKKIIVVINLKHAKLRGIESQGMLLAGVTENEETIGLLTVDKSEAGDKVYIEGYENSNAELSFDDFLKLDIKVKNNHAVFDGKELKTDKDIVRVEKVKDGARVR
jgi:methionyl-tRNA synthetase